MALAQGRFTRDQRIRKRSEYRGILNGGVRVTTTHCVFVVASQRPMSDCPAPARLGLVVSRKVGGAVLRNRFKRLAREVFRKSQAQLPRGADIVLIARSWSRELKEQSLAEEWASVADRIGWAFERYRRKSKHQDAPVAGAPC